jgi:hypothetical protein
MPTRQVLALCGLLFPTIALPALAAPQWKIAPPDVYVLVERFADELELLRLEMGAPKHSGLGFSVEDARPREVFDQAAALLRQAKRFSYEQTGKRGGPVDIPDNRDYQPSDVHAVVSAALERLMHVKQANDIPEKVEPRKRDRKKRPTDVYNAILASSRQLNLMLDQRLAPTDVYTLVTLVNGYATGILASYEEAQVPEQPVFERRKRPADVYRRLLKCFEITEDIAKRAGLSTLRISTDRVDFNAVGPPEVYELATTLLSELDYLHGSVGAGERRFGGLGPDRKWPSDVYQYAGFLELQLEAIRQQSERNPRKIGNSGGVSASSDKYGSVKSEPMRE